MTGFFVKSFDPSILAGKKLLVSAEEAGGCNFLLAFLEENQLESSVACFFAGKGAATILQNRSLPFRWVTCCDLEPLQMSRSSSYAVVMCHSVGFSCEKILCAELEGLGLQLARIGFLDTNVNMWQRFASSPSGIDAAYLPDQLVVPSIKVGSECVKEGFPPNVLRVMEHPFDKALNDVGFPSQLPGWKRQGELSILLLLEAGMEDSDEWKWDNTESYIAEMFEIIRYSLNDLVVKNSESGLFSSIRLWVRGHPHDDCSQFLPMFCINGIHTAIDEKLLVEDSLSAVDIVLGIGSMALRQAAMAGKRTYSPSLDSAAANYPIFSFGKSPAPLSTLVVELFGEAE